MTTQETWKPVALAPLSTILLLAGLTTGGGLGTPHAARAQVRPEVGGAVSLLAGLGGDAWSGFEEAVGLGAEVGAGLGSGWRVSAALIFRP